MGGNQVYNPALPTMPSDMSAARSFTWDSILNSVKNPSTAPFSFAYNQNPQQSQAADLYSYLAGGPAPNTMTAGGPQRTSGGGAGGVGMPLDTIFPMGKAYDETSNMLSEALKTGFLGDTSQLWGAKRNLYGQNLSDWNKQSWQDNYLSGGRVGTGIANLIGENTNRAGIGLASEMAPFDYQNINDAANRRLSAGSLGLSMSDLLGKTALDRTGALAGFGQQEFTNTQTMQDKAYQDWLRQQPGYGPMWENMMKYATTYPFSAQSPTVATPWWQDILKGIIGGGSSAATAAILAPK